MSHVRFVRFTTAFLGSAAVVAALSTQQVPAPTQTADPPAASAWVPPSPTNAGKIFRWGNKQWGDEFKTPLLSMWRVNHPGMVRDQHGMLTLDAPQTSTDVTATLAGHNRTYGRWEARVRGHLSGSGTSAYTLFWELVPSNQSYHCGAGNLVLSQYTLGSNTAYAHVRTLPNADFATSKWLYLNGNEFHTYAVEVTPDHVSWFVDTKVIRTERRPEALAGVPYTVRFRLQGVPGAVMKKGRMQMDWVRFYSLERKNAQPITAPQLARTTYADAC